MMVFYSIDTGSRKKVYFFSAVIAVALSSSLFFLEQYINYRAIAPSSIMFFGGILALYDKFLWKWPIIGKLTDIPNLNGIWLGELHRRNGEKHIAVKLIISQSWKKIDLILESDQTISETISAAMYVENERRVRIVWTYAVRSRSMLEKQNLYGEGVTELRLLKGNETNTLEGTYFSSKLRKGHIIVHAQQLH